MYAVMFTTVLQESIYLKVLINCEFRYIRYISEWGGKR